MEHPGQKHRGLIKDSGFEYGEKGESGGVEGDPGVCWDDRFRGVIEGSGGGPHAARVYSGAGNEDCS